MLKFAFTIGLVFFVLLGMPSSLVRVGKAQASGTIHIRADGNVDPPTVNIMSVDNITYTFTDNVHDLIIVERDNIVVDGNGYSLQGPAESDPYPIGFELVGRSNVTIQNTRIIGFNEGIALHSSSNNIIHSNYINENWLYGVNIQSSFNNTIRGNNIANSTHSGIRLTESSYNIISENNITENSPPMPVRGGGYGIFICWSSNNNILSQNTIAKNNRGIWLSSSDNNIFSGNTITDNGYGIWLESSSNNKFHQNNLIANYEQVYITTLGYASFWDDGSKGNYWSDYNGTDLDGDGIGDTPHTVCGDNLDNYPLIESYSGLHDIGVAIRASKTVVGQGYNTTITLDVTARNHSEQTESFNLTFNMPGTDFETELNLTGWGSLTFTFALNTTGFTIGNYTLWSYVCPVPSEGDMKDNNRSLTIRVTIPSDISSTNQGIPDGRVDMGDI